MTAETGDGLRVEVRRGHATPTELAAVVAAVEAARHADAASAAPAPATPGWLRAALAEGVGGARSGCPGDLPTARW